MILKGIVEEDYCNYKEPSMTLMFPKCSFKCDKENGTKLCHNSEMVNSPDIEVLVSDLMNRYSNNPITKAVVCSGLEPFDSCRDLYNLIIAFRQGLNNKDPIIIYTGYTEKEIKEYYPYIYNFSNIIIKFGRFIPNQEPHIDKLLGVSLPSNNQYAKKIN